MHFVRGESIAVGSQIRELLVTAAQPMWFASGETPWSWSCARALFEQLQDQLDSTAIARAVGTRRAAIDLLCATPVAFEPTGLRRPSLGAHLASHLSHNWLSKRPLVETLGTVFARLLRSADATLVVPDLRAVDDASQMLLRELCRRGFENVVIGHSSDPAALSTQDDHAPDTRGIVWRMQEHSIHRIAASLLLAPGVTVHEPTREGDGPLTTAFEPPRMPEDDCLARLESGPSGTDLAVAVDLLRSCFRGFGYFSALTLGVTLLDHSDQLSVEDRAEVLEIVALTAHNRQFRSEGNLDLGAFILRLTQQALEIETRPAIRSALFYRLAVSLGRRLDRLEEAETSASAGIRETVAGVPPLESAYLAAWCHNIRAYARMRRSDNAGAERDTFDATRLLRPFSDHAASSWKTDVEASTALFASGVSTMKLMQREVDNSAEWRVTADQLAPTHPGEGRFKPAFWIGLSQATQRPDLALAHAKDAVAACRAEHDGFREYSYLLVAADQEYRLGRIDDALTTFGTLRSRHRRYGATPFLPSPELPSVPARVEAGDVDDADAILTAALDRGLAPRRSAEAHLWLARIAGHRGDEVLADALADRAIDDAVASGRLETLVLVATRVGDLAADLGCREDARESYSRALTLCAGGDADVVARLPADRLRAMIGIAEVTGARAVSVGEAVQLVPGALHHPQGWWLLSRLLRWLAADPEGAEAAGLDDVNDALAQLHDAARLREDCRMVCASVLGIRHVAAPPGTTVIQTSR